MDIEKIKRDALAAYPNANGDVTLALALRVSALQRHTQERNDLLNVNARQAQMLASAYKRDPAT